MGFIIIIVIYILFAILSGFLAAAMTDDERDVTLALLFPWILVPVLVTLALASGILRLSRKLKS